MNSNKRKFILGVSAVTAGFALSAKSLPKEVHHNNQDDDRKGIEGKHYGMLVDLRRCVGCQSCTIGCSMENQTPVGQFRTTVKQYQVTVENQTSKAFMLPKLCNHCDNPPCVEVCPVQATFKRKDGIVMVDNHRCVGCAYCVQACPYDARFINEETKTADKCTFCAHRLEAGLLPACVETCVGGARIIGDLNDPNSEINKFLNEHKSEIKVLKPDQNTNPNVYYLGIEDYFTSKVIATPSIYQILGENHDS